MKVIFKHITPLHVVSEAIRECYDSHDKSDSIYNCDDSIIGEKDRALIHRVGNVNKHNSVLEHLVFNIGIQGVSRMLLQEFARHRIASLSVKSTRFTLQELEIETPFTGLDQDGLVSDETINRASNYIVFAPPSKLGFNQLAFMTAQVEQLELLRRAISEGIPRDVAKYLVPDSYKTNISWTINARSMQNFLTLRSAKNAHFEIRELAHLIFNEMPEEYKYLFLESMGV